MEIIEEPVTVTAHGVFQTVRMYDYDKNIVTLIRKFNGKQVSLETFYID